MIRPTRDDLALHAMGHFEGDRSELERWLADDPDARAQLAAEAELELLLRDVARAATFCEVCHDLVRDERCESCAAARPARARRTRPSRAPVVLAAVTLAAVVIVGAILFGTASESEAPRKADPAVVVGAQPPADVALPRPAAPVPAAPPAKPTRTVRQPPAVVELKIVTRPAGVAVLLDGRELGLTPLVVKVPRRTTQAELRFVHVGYQELVQRIALTADTRLAFTLTSRGGPLVHAGKFADDQCMQCHKPQPRASVGPAPLLIRNQAVPKP